MKAQWMLAIAVTLVIAQGVHAGDSTPDPAASQSQKGELRKPPHIYPTVSQEQLEAEYPEELKAQRRAEAAIAENAWVLKVPHVKGMMPMWIMDQTVPRDEAIEKGTGVTGIRVWVDEPENVREVEGQVPSQLSGVPVVVEANPTGFVAW
jgi:hypothetical protein